MKHHCTPNHKKYRVERLEGAVADVKNIEAQTNN